MKELGPAEFSAVTGLSVKALRLYDERGLLVPARADPVTGYRRYAEDQIAAAGRIALLRRAGTGRRRDRPVASGSRGRNRSPPPGFGSTGIRARLRHLTTAGARHGSHHSP